MGIFRSVLKDAGYKSCRLQPRVHGSVRQHPTNLEPERQERQDPGGALGQVKFDIAAVLHTCAGKEKLLTDRCSRA